MAVRIDRSSPDADYSVLNAPVESGSAELAAEAARPQEADDLDALLAEFENGTAKPADPFGTSDDEIQLRTERARLHYQQQAFNSEVETHAHQLALEKHNADYNSLIKDLRGDLDENLFPDKLVRAWIDAEARENEDLQHAWMNRDQNARSWGQTKHQLQKQFHSYASRMPDPALTEDREAVAAAVRGSSVAAPMERPADLSRLSNDEFRKYTLDHYGIQSNV
jgi:hypothetical protein